MTGFAGIFTWPGRTLTRKFILLLVGFLLLQGAQLFIGVSGNLHLGEGAVFINDAGRQRLRTLQLASLTHQAAMAGSWLPAQRRTFDETLAEYETFFSNRLAQFVEGRSRIEELLDTGQPAPARALFAEARQAWQQELKPLSLGIDPARPRAAQNVLARYEALALLQVARLDRAVVILEDDTRRFSRRLALLQGVILGLSLLLGLVGLVMARYVVTLPLRRLIGATRAVTDGAYDRRIAVSSRDELGELALTFNRMLDAIGEKTERIMAFNRVAAAITSSLSVQEIVNQVLPQSVDLSGMQAVSLTFYDQNKGQFGESFANGLSGKFIDQMQFRPGGLAEEVFTSGEPVLCSDHPQAVHKLSPLARDEGIRSYLCLPLLSHTSRLGVLCFYRSDSETFGAEETSLLSAFARLAAQAIENARLHARTEEMAVTDVLTGLHNRRWLDGRLQEEVQRSQRFDKSLSVLMLDIDHFKRINDQYGHPAGDAVLKHLAEVVVSQLREVDLATRYGGEEFVVMLPETDDAAAMHGAERIRRAVAGASFTLPDGSEISMTVSIGVASYPGSAAGAEELIAHADQALYLAKQAGRNRVALYRDMLTAEIEKDPNRIVELLREGPQNIQPVVTAVAAKAAFYRGHNDVVEQTAMHLAGVLDLAPAEREALRLASQLHDIGMVVIPDAVLNKKTALTPAEWQQIHQHPAVAAQFLEQVPALRLLAPIVRHHHERWDGGGYPDGLKGEAIPYLARVLAVADTYAALVSDWLGRQAVSLTEARAGLRAGAGTQFDPALVERFLQALETKAP
jgi:diguanylate cyclase (GGDEF)-like protein